MDIEKVTKLASQFKTASKIIKLAEEVARERTVLIGEGLAKALHAGYKSAFGKEPTLEELASGWSQAMHEQGGNFYNYNFGNITATKKYIESGGMYTLFENIKEYTSTGERMAINKNYFRAYPSAEAGATGYWKYLTHHYKDSFKWMQSGDPVNAALKLSDEYYYTGDRRTYAKNMSFFYDKFFKTVAPKLKSEYPELKSDPKPPPEGPPPEFKAHRKSTEISEVPEKLKAIQTQYAYKGNEIPQSVPQSFIDEVDSFTKQLFASKNKTAVIIKGNPKYINNNKKADSFYDLLKKELEESGYKVSFDSGKAYTSPKKADIWVGHSRGVDRLEFAPKGVKTIAIGADDFKGALNHPKDKLEIGKKPADEHYEMTKEMMSKFRKLISYTK